MREDEMKKAMAKKEAVLLEMAKLPFKQLLHYFDMIAVMCEMRIMLAPFDSSLVAFRDAIAAHVSIFKAMARIKGEESVKVMMINALDPLHHAITGAQLHETYELTKHLEEEGRKATEGKVDDRLEELFTKMEMPEVGEDGKPKFH